MTRPVPSLSAPIEIGKWWRNRAHDATVIRLLSWKNRNVVDLRVWRSADGRLKPTTKGLTTDVRHLQQLTKALGRAVDTARELGLLATDDGDAQ